MADKENEAQRQSLAPEKHEVSEVSKVSIKKEDEMSDLERLAFYNIFSSTAEIGASDTLSEILRRHSMGGFLGREEDLIEIKKQDYLTLQKYGLSYEDLASRLEKMANASLDNYRSTNNAVTILDSDYNIVELKNVVELKNGNRPFLEKSAGGKGLFHIRPFIKPLRNSRMLKELPSAYYMVIVERIGDAGCPWNNLPKELEVLKCGYGQQANYDFTVRNLKSREKLEFNYNLMQVHMIAKHHFFEGRKTMSKLINKNSYRIEPEEIIETLELDSRGQKKEKV